MIWKSTARTRSGKPLHVGAGQARIDGWTNIDIQPHANVDEVLDIREGLPFEDVPYIFAEHFIEHLTYTEGFKFLRECRRVLRDDGRLRLSTPNLDWVWLTQYHFGQWASQSEAVRDCFWMNKGFRGWGHQFLYNLPTLTSMLKQAGFQNVEACRYGESPVPFLQGLERHERYLDTPDLPHVIVVEASGREKQSDEELVRHASDYLAALAAR